LAAGFPQSKKYETLPLVVQLLNDAVGKVFPPAPGVSVGLSTADGQYRVEDQDTLSTSPVLQVAMPGRFNANSFRGLTKNILQ
jgi:hypothetical protein